MQKVSTSERKLAMRMMLREMRRGDSWSDGKRVYRGAELAKARKALVDRLAGPRPSAVPASQHRTSNALVMLRTYLRNPGIHGLPADLNGILRSRASALSSWSIAEQPGISSHLAVLRRLGRRLGAIAPAEFAPEREFGYRRERLAKAPALRVNVNHISVERQREHGGFEPHWLVKGDRLTRMDTPALRWRTDDGAIVSIHRLDPVFFTPSRPGKPLEPQLTRDEEPDDGPGL